MVKSNNSNKIIIASVDSKKLTLLKIYIEIIEMFCTSIDNKNLKNDE